MSALHQEGVLASGFKKKILVTPGIKSAGDPTNQGGEDGVLGPI